MSPFLGEFVGTALLIIMGDGVVANVVLNKTKGQNSGWIVITFGWAMAVFLGCVCFHQTGWQRSFESCRYNCHDSIRRF